tara:strand:+ start:108 stop:659 length:552 start_codon:yes stop_codon:yes gene_type:complete
MCKNITKAFLKEIADTDIRNKLTDVVKTVNWQNHNAKENDKWRELIANETSEWREWLEKRDIRDKEERKHSISRLSPITTAYCPIAERQHIKANALDGSQPAPKPVPEVHAQYRRREPVTPEDEDEDDYIGWLIFWIIISIPIMSILSIIYGPSIILHGILCFIKLLLITLPFVMIAFSVYFI